MSMSVNSISWSISGRSALGTRVDERQQQPDQERRLDEREPQPDQPDEQPCHGPVYAPGVAWPVGELGGCGLAMLRAAWRGRGILPPALRVGASRSMPLGA